MGRSRRFEINGKPVESVSGGTRWGGGLWINSEDLARFGLLILNKGNWDGKQLVSEKWITEATLALGPRARLRVSLVAQHEAEAVAERAGVELRRRRQRRQHHLDRSGPRHRSGMALARTRQAVDGMIQRIVRVSQRAAECRSLAVDSVTFCPFRRITVSRTAKRGNERERR